jgi:hypothetical protein
MKISKILEIFSRNVCDPRIQSLLGKNTDIHKLNDVEEYSGYLILRKRKNPLQQVDKTIKHLRDRLIVFCDYEELVKDFSNCISYWENIPRDREWYIKNILQGKMIIVYKHIVKTHFTIELTKENAKRYLKVDIPRIVTLDIHFNGRYVFTFVHPKIKNFRKIIKAIENNYKRSEKERVIIGGSLDEIFKSLKKLGGAR